MNELVHLAEFEAVLKDYQVSHDNQTVLNQTLALMAAPTSAGRNAIIKELVKTGRYYFIVSDTTRSPRVNNGVLEQNGVEYFFRSEAEILADLKAGKFLEAAIIHQQQVSGISLRELINAQRQGKVAITDIENTGARRIWQAKPATKMFFILPPSIEVWLGRLLHRGTLTEAEIRRRLTSSVEEFKDALAQPYYHFIINDALPEATAQIRQIIETGVENQALQAKGRQQAEALLAHIQEHLKSRAKS